MKIVRTQPPVGYPFSWRDLVLAVGRTLGRRGGRKRFEAQVADALGVHSAFFLSSGKAALVVALQALSSIRGRTQVIVPAYTCYSVPSAIVKAGLDVAPCDIAHGTFDYDYSRLASMLDDNILCVLAVDLFGAPVDVERLRRMCQPHGIAVVEDAAQAMGCMSRQGALLGTRGDVGFYSFGRGKHVTCGSGGLIVTNSPETASACRDVTRTLPTNGSSDALRALVTLVALSIFVRPHLYWLPSGISALRLGQTIFHDDFPVRRPSNLEAALLDGWHETVRQLGESRLASALFYAEHLPGCGMAQPEVPLLRYPVLVEPDGKRDLIAKGRRLGISEMYPGTVGAIRQLASRLPRATYPGADRLVASLVTLPTHGMLSDDERQQICDLVRPVALVDAPGVTKMVS